MTTVELTSLLGSLHFRLISLVRLVLERNGLYDINNTQAAVLLTIGDGELKAVDLLAHGFNYYGMYGLVDAGYMTWNPNPHDKRSGFYKLTKKGLQVVKLFHHLFRDQEQEIDKTITEEEFKQLIRVLNQIDSFYVTELNQPRRPMQNR